MKFNTKALTPPLALTTVTTASTNAGGAHKSAVDSYNATGRTNWQDSLLSAKTVFTSASPTRTVPKLIVFVTDGAPNTINNGSGTTNYSDASASAVDPAVTQMNAIKALGVHSLVVGAGQAFNDTSPANARIDALYRVSQYPTPKIYPATAFDAATTDLILQRDFSALEETLRAVANQICDGILTVTKYASSADAPDTYTKQGTGWDFTTSVSPAGDWIKPTTGSGAAKTVTTDADGMTLFQWNPGTPTWTKSATVTDVSKNNFTPDRVTCTVNGEAVADPVLTGKDFPIDVGAGKQVACKVYNKYTGPPNVDVGIVKTASVASVVVGDTVTWSLKASNDGPNTATNVKFTDVLPAGVGTPTAVTTTAGSFVAATGVWTIPTLGVGAGNAQTLTFKTTVNTVGDHLNKVSLTSLTEKDTNSANDKSEANVKGVKTDVTVAKTANVSSQVVGSNVVWTITATNLTNVDAKDVKVVDTLGANLTYVSDDGSGAYNDATKTWTIGNLDATSTKTLKITTTSNVAGATNNKVVISTSTPESDTTNNDATATTTFTIADLTVTKQADKNNVLLGDTVTWTITVTNTGDAPAKDVVVTDAIPATLTNVTTDPQINGNTWNVGTIPAGGTKVLTVTSTVSSLDPITNQACAATSTPEKATTNNCGEDTVTATASDVSVTKVPDLTEVYINGTVIWTVTVSNTGKANAANVVVTDTAPAGLSLGSTVGAPSQGAYNPVTQVWTVGIVNGTVSSPPTGATATLKVSSTVGNTLGALTNKVDVTTDTPETDTTNNKGEGTTNVTASDVTIKKTADKPNVLLGDNVVWTVKVTNNGPAAANAVVVTDVIPAGLTVLSSSTVPAGGSLAGSTWNVGTLAGNGGSATLTVTTKTTATGTITNSSTVTTTTPETDYTNNESHDSVTVTVADVSLTKDVDNSGPSLDGTVVWTIVATNAGSADAKNTTVDDLLPAGLEYVSSNPSVGTYDAVTGVWTIGTLAKNGGTATLTITTKSVELGTITNEACVSTTTRDKSNYDDCDDETITVRAPQLSIVKTADTYDVGYQGEVTWTITASNTGDADALGVVVTDTVPTGGLTVDSFNAAPNTSYDQATGIWTIGTLAAGTEVELILTTTVTKVGTVTNQVCIETDSSQGSGEQGSGEQGSGEQGSGERDPQTPLCDDDTVKVHAPIVTVTKTADDHAPGYEGTVVWTITATNSGDADAENVVVTDTIPAGLTVDSSLASQGTFPDSNGNWALGTLAQGTSETLTLTTTVTELGPITNTACIDTTTPQVDETPQCDDDTVVVTAPNLSITKVASTPDALLNDTLTWTIVVTNNGDADATSVVVKDTKPAGLTITGSEPSQGSYDADTDTWSVGTVTKGASATLELSSKVTKTGSLTNKACVTTATTQVESGLRCDDDTVTVTAADVTIVKTADKPVLGLGGQVTWTLVATNNGDADAADVKVVDAVPANLDVDSAVGSGTTTYDLATNVWTIGTLTKGGGSATLTLVTTPTTTGSFTNVADITTTTPETDYTNNHCEDTTVVKAPDLSIIKTADEHQTYLGGSVEWTVTVRNNGNWVANNVVVEDTVPAGLTVTSASPSKGTYDTATDVWSIGALDPNESVTLTLVTSTTLVGDWTNVACVQTTSPQTGEPIRCDDDTTTVTRDVKLTILKVQDESTPSPRPVGSELKYGITMTNEGKSPADDVHFTDVLPSGLDFVSAIGTDWTCTNASNTVPSNTVPINTVNCTYDIDLAAGTTTPKVTITTTVTAALLRSDPVTNTACITPSEIEQPAGLVAKALAVEDDAQCSSVTTEFPKGELVLVKTNNPTAENSDSLRFGDEITYTLDVSATGNLDQHDVVISDDLPGYGSNASSSPTTLVVGSATCLAPPAPTATNCGVTTTSANGKVTSVSWALGDLPAGTHRLVTFKVTIDVAPANPNGPNGDTVTVTNAGSVKATETPDGVPSNEVENELPVVTAVGDTDSSCIDDTPYYDFESDGWFANETVTVHELDKDGNEVSTASVTTDANGHIDGHLLWPGFSIDPATNVKTYPGLDVRPMQFYLEGSPRTNTVTVAYPATSDKCDAALTISKSNSPTGTVEVGDTISYTLTVAAPANGSFNQDDVVVTDYVPGYDPETPESGTTTYVDGSAKCEGTILPTVGTCDVTLTKNSAGKVVKITWALGSMKPGQTLDAVFKVTADDQPDADTDTVKLYNTALVQSAYWPATPSNQVVNTLDLTGVLGTKTPGGVLAATGSDLFRQVGLALSLMIAGAFIMRGSRRREDNPA